MALKCIVISARRRSQNKEGSTNKLEILGKPNQSLYPKV